MSIAKPIATAAGDGFRSALPILHGWDKSEFSTSYRSPVVIPAKAQGCPGNFGCTQSDFFESSAQLFLPVAGLIPAIHVFAVHSAERQEGVGGRAKPGQGGSNVVQTTVRTTEFVSPDSLARKRESRLQGFSGSPAPPHSRGRRVTVSDFVRHFYPDAQEWDTGFLFSHVEFRRVKTFTCHCD